MELKRRTETLPGTKGETCFHFFPNEEANSLNTPVRSVSSANPEEFFSESPGRADLRTPWEKRSVLESKPQRYLGKSQSCIAIASLVCEQPPTDARACPGAASAEHSTPNVRNATRTYAIRVLDRRFIRVELLLLLNTKSTALNSLRIRRLEKYNSRRDCSSGVIVLKFCCRSFRFFHETLHLYSDFDFASSISSESGET